MQPSQVRRAVLDGGTPLEPVPLAQCRVLAPQAQGGLGDLVDVQPRVVGAPVDPRDLVVVQVGVVVATLGAATLVAGGQRRGAGGEASSGERRVGKECDRTCRSRWAPDSQRQKN